MNLKSMKLQYISCIVSLKVLHQPDVFFFIEILHFKYLSDHSFIHSKKGSESCARIRRCVYRKNLSEAIYIMRTCTCVRVRACII